MCGDVLGAAVEGWNAQQIAGWHPAGLTAFQPTERGFGRYTDDTQMAIALSRSLIARGGRCEDVAAARSYAVEYDPSRGYGATAARVLQDIKQTGVDATSIQTIGAKYLPNGSFANGGAMRIAPLGLVYRHAPAATLRSAVASALRCTHVHPVAVDGAFVIALAVGYLATRQPGDPTGASAGPATAVPSRETLDAAGAALGAAGAASGTAGATAGPAGPGAAAASGGVCGEQATPLKLLDYLLAHRGLLETEGMASKLLTVRTTIASAPSFKPASEPWSEYLSSSGWAAEQALGAAVAETFQIRADDAVAVALAALCWHWLCPEDALVAAVHYGGDTDTIAAITGALAGALHGLRWIPARWWAVLENGPAGRDEVVQLATQLAELSNSGA
ncbi:Poly(ADP-ribose) glycohydrolase ARH3 [Tetrabaena socialis]|uniref:ADP-ribosylhydrolase ARH3 n=1 Tax=Tetrabaena socialis TaxID=47790 RepID=A0A2J8AB56_9CHLO|nr:Poly(ADP-ribose) glycohydrolase ARH3 [Tetrabaena socialis]|eukprot:PNH09759.1 Poly(ADP-ribose) glycohydrolase ARH3 [Tetrabaena socialis]